jgi:phage gp45-like
MSGPEDVNRRLASLYGRGVVRHADVANGMASMQAEFYRGEQRRVEVPQGFGFASVPKPGAELFAVFADGEREHGVALAFEDRRYRPVDLKSGEVALYGLGARSLPFHWIKFTDDPKPGTIKIRAKRIELRAGDYYRVLDADTGEHAGTHPANSPNLPV